MKRLKDTTKRDHVSQEAFEREEAYMRAEKKLKDLKGFYWHLFWYVAVNFFLLVNIFRGLDSDESIFQYRYFTTAFFWGIGLFFHWFGVFGKHLIFSKNWEDRKVQEFIDKDKKGWE